MSKQYPKRSKNHQTGDIAKGQLMDIFYSHGWAVEEIKHDYGEDLILQIAINEQLLPFRVFIQLKGTENFEGFKKNDMYKYPGIKTTTVRRWIDSNELISIILWDVKKRKGVFTFTDEIFSTSVNNKKTKTMSIYFHDPKGNSINSTNLKKFQRMCLAGYLHKRQTYLEGLRATIYLKKTDKQYKSTINAINQQIADVIILYLEHVEIIEWNKSGSKFHITSEFHELIIENIGELAYLAKDDSKESMKQWISNALILTIIKWHNKKYEQGLPENIIIPLANVIDRMHQYLFEKIEKMI